MAFRKIFGGLYYLVGIISVGETGMVSVGHLVVGVDSVVVEGLEPGVEDVLAVVAVDQSGVRLAL